MVEQCWNEIRGTLCAEFQIAERRKIDAVIFPEGAEEEVDGRNLSLNQRKALIDGHRVFIVQAKAEPLSMYLMGQTLFSAELIKNFYNPTSVRSLALCRADDPLLHPLLVSLGGQVEIDIEVKAYPTATLSSMSEGPGPGGRQMIDWYWRNVWKDKGYTLEERVPVVNETGMNAQQTVHAVIKKGRSVIVVHAKAGGKKKGKYRPYRLGMYLMGQVLFGAELVKQKYEPRSIRSVALCEKNDDILHPILEDIGKKIGIEMEVVVVSREAVARPEQ